MTTIAPQRVAATADGTTSQTIRAILGLRGLIVAGKLQAGTRVLEQMLVDQLGVSRTPARAAMLRVCEEGLLHALPSGGYAVACFSHSDVFDAVAIRGTLEGMAARLAAERSVGEHLMKALRDCVSELEVVVQDIGSSLELTSYVRLNDQFHDLLCEASGSAMVRRSLERLNALPFAAPNAFVSVAQSDSAAVRAMLSVSQDQHRSIVDAIDRREGTRAESITLEHSRSAWRYLQLVLKTGPSPLRLAGMSLVVSDEHPALRR